MGKVELSPDMPVAKAVGWRDQTWGAAIDPVLARRLGLSVGDRVQIGNLSMEVRARIQRQPDRSLSADWRGPPVLVAAEALATSGLVGPASRLDYEYRVRVDGDPHAWREALVGSFPDAEFEAQTFAHRRGRLGEVLDQVASGLLLIGFSALFVGGLGVFNSVRAYLDSKLATIATLRALGLRDHRLAAIYLFQVLLLAASASLAGALAGGVLAMIGTGVVAERLPLAPEATRLLEPLVAAWLFGVLTAITFALPAIRSCALRDASGAVSRIRSRRDRDAVALVVDDDRIRSGNYRAGHRFPAAAMVRGGLRRGDRRDPSSCSKGWCARSELGRAGSTTTRRSTAVWHGRLAVAKLHRPGSPLRVTLISLGSALTVLVASTVVVVALLRTIEQTIPARAPALVFYDVSATQVDSLRAIVSEARTFAQLDLVPLVLGRMSHVNGQSLRLSADSVRALESRDEHKLTHRLGNIDQVTVRRGHWWPDDYTGPPLVAFEDREADQIGLEVGDRLRFRIMNETLEVELAAIYSQRGLGTHFWFEGVFSDGVLDAFVTRYVGTAYLEPEEAVDLEASVAREMPNVIVVRTERILREARAMLGRAAAGLGVVATVALLASLFVLASVFASSRARQLYDATVLHVLGARIRVIRASLSLEYVLAAVLTSAFAVGLGSAIAAALLSWRIKIDGDGAWGAGVLVAILVSAVSLGLGARDLLRRLRLVPAALLRTSG